MLNKILIALVAMMVSASAHAQSTAAAPEGAGPFFKGQILKSVQRCKDRPGDGVKITVLDISDQGRKAFVAVDIDCWGASWCVRIRGGCSYHGNIQVNGGLISMSFGHTNQSYAENLIGYQMGDNSTPTFRFNSITWHTAGSGAIVSGEMTFR